MIAGAADDTVYGNTGNDVLVGNDADITDVSVNAILTITTIDTTELAQPQPVIRQCSRHHLRQRR